MSNSLIVTEIDFTAKACDKFGCLQSVHHRTLNLAEVQTQACVAQAMVDGFQAFKCAGIDVVDRRTLQHHMFERRSLGYQVVDARETATPTTSPTSTPCTSVMSKVARAARKSVRE